MERGFEVVLKHGILKSALLVLFEVFYWIKFGARTAAGPICIPCPYFLVHQAFRGMALDYRRSVFVDFGSGLGRMLLFASQFPFRRIIGVEISARFAGMAWNILAKYCSKPSRRSPEWRIIRKDAAFYVVPGDANVLFFSDPFGRETLESVVHNILLSKRLAPRRIIVVYVNPGCPEVFIRHGFEVLKSAVNRHNKGYMILCV